MNSAISPIGGGALASATSQTIVVIVPSLAERACGDMIAELQQTLLAEGYPDHAGDAQHLKQQGGQPAQQFPAAQSGRRGVVWGSWRSSGSACRRPALRWWRWEPWRAIPST